MNPAGTTEAALAVTLVYSGPASSVTEACINASNEIYYNIENKMHCCAKNPGKSLFVVSRVLLFQNKGSSMIMPKEKDNGTASLSPNEKMDY